MNAYEQGFDHGERQAFKDAREGRRRVPPMDPHLTPYGRGWWDGYLPRNPAWALVRPAKRSFYETEEA